MKFLTISMDEKVKNTLELCQKAHNTLVEYRKKLVEYRINGLKKIREFSGCRCLSLQTSHKESHEKS